MEEQPKLDEPYSESPLFGSAARNILPEAVAVDYLREDEHLYLGTVDGEYVDTFPFEVTRETIDRGADLYSAYCTPCHGVSGYGDGVVVAEGFQPAASFYSDELIDAPVGRFYQAITLGVGGMYSYASRIQPEDRWAVVAYIQALQLSQHASLDELPPDLQAQFDTLLNR
ncbi:MAG: c-type cytochrome [Anaerolineae bacterium]